MSRRAGRVWGSLSLLASVLLVTAGVLAPPDGIGAATGSGSLPARLSDQEFWSLSTELSEADGHFRSENLVSNEHTFQYVIPALQRTIEPDGVYLGVAPDQNFTYIIATRPRLAFIVDVRRGNLLQHLMYKALIEMSADRAEFLSRLFSKPRPPGVSAGSTAAELFAAYRGVPTSEELYRDNVRSIRERLVRRHGFPLSPDDLDHMESIFFAFFWDGPSLQYSTYRGFGGRGFRGGFPSYEELMLQSDWEGTAHSYLASEAHFQRLKLMQARNAIVPVVGNFAGPRALRSIGRYLRRHGATVSVFYVSNVEQYLFQDGLFEAFAQNVATLPLNGSSTFIRSVSSRFGYPGELVGPDGRASALDPMQAFVRDFAAGYIRVYSDVNSRSR
jgi:hypothetical protein